MRLILRYAAISLKFLYSFVKINIRRHLFFKAITKHMLVRIQDNDDDLRFGSVDQPACPHSFLP